MVFLSTIGLTYFVVLVVPVLWWKKHRELAIDVLVLLIITEIVTEGLKLLFMRERPFEVLNDVHNKLSWGSLTNIGGYAMPSAHTSRAFAVAALIALGTRYRVGVAALVVATLIGLSRIYLGVHWPSDVLAGALLGILLALIMHWVGKRDNPYSRARNKVVAWLRGLKRTDRSSGNGQSS